MPGEKSWQPATLVLKFEGTILAWRDACPHMGVSLLWRPERLLSEDGHHLVCANHGAAFRLPDGACVHGPCRGEALTPVKIEIRDAAVWALWGDGGFTAAGCRSRQPCPRSAGA